MLEGGGDLTRRPRASVHRGGGGDVPAVAAAEQRDRARRRSGDAIGCCIRGGAGDAAAGVDVWALWVASCAASFEAPDRAQEVAGLQRDTTTLVMQAVLAPGLRSHAEVVEASLTAIVRLAVEGQRRRASSVRRRPRPASRRGRWWSTGRRWSARGPSSTSRTAASMPSGRCRTGDEGVGRTLQEHVLADARRRGARNSASLQSTWMGATAGMSRWDSRRSAGTRNGVSR